MTLYRHNITGKGSKPTYFEVDEPAVGGWLKGQIVQVDENEKVVKAMDRNTIAISEEALRQYCSKIR